MPTTSRSPWLVIPGLMLIALASIVSAADPVPIVFDYDGGADFAKATALDDAGNLYVLATCENDDDDYDVVVARFDQTGEVTDQWVYSTYSSGPDPAPQDDIAVDFVIDNAGFIYVLATAGSDPEDPETWNEFHTVKFDVANQSTWLWAEVYAEGQPVGIALHQYGGQAGVAVTGNSLATDPLLGIDFHTICYQYDGNIRWETWCDGGADATREVDDFVVGIATDDEGGVYIAGRCNTQDSPDPGDDDVYETVTIRYAPEHDPYGPRVIDPDLHEWRKEHARGDDNQIQVVDIVTIGPWVATADRFWHSKDETEWPEGQGDNWDIYVVLRETGDGALDEDLVYGTHYFSETPTALTTSTGPHSEYLLGLVGQTISVEESGAEALTLAMQCEADYVTLLWAKTMYAGDGDPDEPETFGVDIIRDGQSGAYRVTGITTATDGEGDILTVMYRGDDGFWRGNWQYGDEPCADYPAGVLCWGGLTTVVGTMEDGEDIVILRYEEPEPWAWKELAPMPRTPSGPNYPVKHGGWLAYNEGDKLIYGAKGNRRPDFYHYDPASGDWAQRAPIQEGLEGKWPDRGCKGVSDGGNYVYVTKGNNSLGFWRYRIAEDSWEQLADVPEGPKRRKVKDGTDLVYVTIGDAGYVYLLKGYDCEFYRYNTSVTTNPWETLADAPIGIKGRWKRGSFLVYDEGARIFAHKASYTSRTTSAHEMYTYNIYDEVWSLGLPGMPLCGMHGNDPSKKKKSKDGGCGVWQDGDIYALKGGNTKQFFKCNAAGGTWVELDTLPRYSSTGKKRVKYGADIVFAGESFYALKGNRTFELWKYGEEEPGGAFGSRQTPVAGERRGTRPSLSRTRLPGAVSASLRPFAEPGAADLRVRAPLSAGPDNYLSLPGQVQAPGQDMPKRLGGGPRTDADTVFDVLSECAPAWSPDGQWLAYSRYDPTFGWDRLFRYNPWTAQELPIDQPPAHCSGPAWSPSGEWVAYEVDSPGSGFTQIWRSSVGGTVSVVAPMTCQPYDHSNVQWSPDGMFLV